MNLQNLINMKRRKISNRKVLNFVAIEIEDSKSEGKSNKILTLNTHRQLLDDFLGVEFEIECPLKLHRQKNLR